MKILVSRTFPMEYKLIASWFPQINWETVTIREGSHWKNYKAAMMLLSGEDVAKSGIPTPENCFAIVSKSQPDLVNWVYQETPEDSVKNLIAQAIDCYQSKLEQGKIKEQIVEFMELALMGKVALDIMHDLNNPLQVILGFTQDILENNDSKDIPFLEDLNLIEKETLYCSEILRRTAILAQTTPPGESYQCLNLLLDRFLPLIDLPLRKKNILIERVTPNNLSFILDKNNKAKTVILSVLLEAIQNAQKNSSLYFIAESDGDFVSVFIKIYAEKEEIIPNISLKSYLDQLGIPLDGYAADPMFVYVLKFPKEK